MNLLLWLSVFHSLTVASSTEKCASGDAGGHSFRWCARLPADPRPGTLLFYLHGNGGDERSWDAPSHDLLERTIEAKGKKLPVVITISFGATWFLSDTNGFRRPSLLAAYAEAIQKVEKSLNLPAVKERWLMGESMGGFNSLQLYFKRPALFSRVVSYCPAVLNFSPFAPRSEVEAYISRHEPYVIRKLVEKWRDKMQTEYSSPAAWVAHDPRALDKPQREPRLFLGANGRDAFGFQEGTEVIRKKLQQQKAKLEWHYVNAGGHCEYDDITTAALAAFLAP
jgi:pimeloyl-ACP methyl ester carboxylesterase